MRLLLTSFILLTLVSGPAFAVDNPNLYTIDNISIDIPNTGKTREQALAKAQNDALQQLFTKLLSPDDQIIRQEVNQELLQTWVEQVKIENESITPKSYRAQFCIGFNRFLVDQFLNERGLAGKNPETATSTFLIIPVFQDTASAKPVVWEDNPWHTAWSVLPLQSTVTSLTVPLGDIEDIRDLNTSQILNLEKPAFDRIAQRYQTGDSLILAAQLDSQNQLHVAVSRLGNIDQARFYEKTFPVNPQSLAQDFGKITKLVAGDLDVLLSQEKLAETDQSTLEADINVPLSTLAEWQDIQARLKKTPSVQGYEVLSLNRLQATIHMKTRTDMVKLKESLLVNGLNLDQASQGWVLKLDPPQPLLQKPTSSTLNSFPSIP